MFSPSDPEAEQRELAGLLRRAVWDVAAAQGPRHHHPLTVQAGTPGGETACFVPDRDAAPIDQTLAADVVAALLRRVSPRSRALGWIARSGPLEPQDADLLWLAAMRQGAAEAGITFPTGIVTRRGWHDPATGEGRRWARVRPR